MTSTPIVKLARLTLSHRKYHRGGGSSLQQAYVRAFVDGYLVTRSAGKPWRCSCPAVTCNHGEAIVAILTDDAIHGLNERVGSTEEQQC